MDRVAWAKDRIIEDLHLMGRGGQGNKDVCIEIAEQHTYTDDEWEFAAAADEYCRERRRKFLPRSEMLHVLLALGYRKVAPSMTVREAREMHRRPLMAETN